KRLESPLASIITSLDKSDLRWPLSWACLLRCCAPPRRHGRKNTAPGALGGAILAAKRSVSTRQREHGFRDFIPDGLRQARRPDSVGTYPMTLITSQADQAAWSPSTTARTISSGRSSGTQWLVPGKRRTSTRDA